MATFNPILTIGHSNHPLLRFLDLLGRAKVTAVAARAAENGLLLLTCGIHHQVIRWIPPIDVTVAEVEEALGTFERALRG